MTDETNSDFGEPRSSERRHRGWLVAVAAAVAGALVFSGTLFAPRMGDARIRARLPVRAGTVPTTDPTNPSTVVTPPPTAPGDGSRDGPLVPSGAPTSTTPGVLVAAITVFHKGAYRLYEDGRLLWYDETRFADTPLSLRGRFGWAEQRLSPEGVERVRSEFLASGLFDPTRPSSDVPTCTEFLQVCVRDESRWLAEETDPQPYGDPTPAVLRLFEYLGRLDATLPPTDWADEQVRTHVPARIGICFRLFINRPGRQAVEVPLDLPVLLSRFPTRAATLLAVREPSAALAKLLAPTRDPDPAANSCFDVSLDEARTLADAFLGPSGGGAHEYWGIVIRFGRRPDPAQPGATRREAAYLSFGDLLPEGAPSAYFGG